MVSHLIPPSVCASCRLCCNFRRCSAWESPSLSPDLTIHLQRDGVPLTQRTDGSTTFALHFPEDAPPEYAALCPVLDPSSGCRLPREIRPIECRLWPLRLMRSSEGTLCIGLYEACPALSQDIRTQLIREATGPMLPFLLNIAHSQPFIVRPTNSAYSIIWKQTEPQSCCVPPQ